ncbi:MAG: hypothetical protein IPG80_04570 [Anaerolineales bacterium]|uniref:hypothetical protein n=1 Tax=Candidatus Villigracilis vicinus TaxID=3140679 RepID=UPI003135F386|nr:hypothetical protein [Anaerolineales bacterium]
MMQEKRIVGALQAEQNAKAQAAIAKAAQADMTQEEKLSAYKQTAGYIARQESNAEYERQKALGLNGQGAKCGVHCGGVQGARASQTECCQCGAMGGSGVCGAGETGGGKGAARFFLKWTSPTNYG